MTETCPLCDHAKIVAIDAAIDEKRLPSVMVRQFRLNPVVLAEHIAHRSVPILGKSDNASVVETSIPLPVQALNGVGETAPEPLQPAPGYLPDESAWMEPASEQPIDVLNVGLPYVRKSFRLAGTDEEEQQRLLQILNDAIASERMGL